MDSTAFTQHSNGLVHSLQGFIDDPELTAADYDLAGAGGSSTAAFAGHVQQIRTALQEKGRDPASFPISKRIFLSVHERPEQARAEVHRWFSEVYHNPELTASGGVYGTPEQGDPPQALMGSFSKNPRQIILFDFRQISARSVNSYTHAATGFDRCRNTATKAGMFMIAKSVDAEKISRPQQADNVVQQSGVLPR